MPIPNTRIIVFGIPKVGKDHEVFEFNKKEAEKLAIKIEQVSLEARKNAAVFRQELQRFIVDK